MYILVSSLQYSICKLIVSDEWVNELTDYELR